MNKFLKYCFLIFASVMVLFTPTCIEPFRPDLGDKSTVQILVVEGLITNEPGSFNLKLSRSVPLDTLHATFPETGALVQIVDDQGQVYPFYESEPGIYICENHNERALPNRSYQLQIIDSEGNDYESSMVKMEKTPALEDVFWEEVSQTIFVENEAIEEKGLNIYLKTGDAQASYIKWEFTETWKVEMPNNITALDFYGMPYDAYVIVPPEKKHCWVSSRESNILLKSFENQAGSKVDSFLLRRIRENEDLLHYKYSIEVVQYALDKIMYEFWKSLKEFNDNQGSMYDRVPYSIFGNITCCSNSKIQVLGYFDAAEIKKKRIFINRYEHEVPTMNKYEVCTYVTDITGHPFTAGFYARGPYCADCRNTGSNIQPDFWETNDNGQ